MKFIARIETGVVGGIVTRVVVPDAEIGAEILRSYVEGQPIVADVRGARNPRQLNLYWVLMGFLADNHPLVKDKNDAHDKVRYGLGLVESTVDMAGVEHLRPKSISFESMDQGEFDPFFKRAVELICAWLGNSPEEVMDALYHLIGDKRYNDVLDRVYRHVVGRKRR